MRLRIALPRWALLVAMLLVALVLLMPMRLALGWAGVDALGVSARAVRGSVWGGQLVEAQVAGSAMGAVRVRLAALPLLIGRATLIVAGTGLDGSISVSRRSVALAGLNATINRPPPLAALHIDSVRTTALSVRFADGVCDAASGEVALAIDSRLMAGAPLPPLIGKVRCDAGQLLIPVTSASGLERIDLRIAGDGTWRGHVTMTRVPDAVRAALGGSGGGSGFAVNGDTLTIDRAGRF